MRWCQNTEYSTDGSRIERRLPKLFASFSSQRFVHHPVIFLVLSYLLILFTNGGFVSKLSPQHNLFLVFLTEWRDFEVLVPILWWYSESGQFKGPRSTSLQELLPGRSVVWRVSSSWSNVTDNALVVTTISGRLLGGCFMPSTSSWSLFLDRILIYSCGFGTSKSCRVSNAGELRGHIRVTVANTTLVIWVHEWRVDLITTLRRGMCDWVYHIEWSRLGLWSRFTYRWRIWTLYSHESMIFLLVATTILRTVSEVLVFYIYFSHVLQIQEILGVVYYVLFCGFSFIGSQILPGSPDGQIDGLYEEAS